MDYVRGGGEYYRRGHVPAFGSWDWNDAVPFTQCFETATTQQPAFLRYAPPQPQDRDLYLAGDLYNHHHLVAPAVILLPRRRAKVGQEPTEEKKRTASKEKHYFKTEARELNAPTSCPTPVVRRRMKAPKPGRRLVQSLPTTSLWQTQKEKRRRWLWVHFKVFFCQHGWCFEAPRPSVRDLRKKKLNSKG